MCISLVHYNLLISKYTSLNTWNFNSICHLMKSNFRCFIELCVIFFYICWLTLSCCLKLIVVYFSVAFLLYVCPIVNPQFSWFNWFFLVEPVSFLFALLRFDSGQLFLITFCCSFSFWPVDAVCSCVLLSTVLRSRRIWLLQFVCFQWATHDNIRSEQVAV